MNKSIVYVLVFAGGAGTGFLAGKKFLETKYNAIAQEEIDSVKEVYGRDLDELRRVYSEDFQKLKMDKPIDPDTVEPEPDFRHIPSPLVRSSLGDNPYEKAKQNYSLVKDARPVISDRGEVAQFEVVEEPEIDTSKPYIIDDVQYAEENDEFEKLALVYYTDGVLVDENDDGVDVDYTIGQVAYKTLLKHPANMWVRNENVAADYEIIVMHTAYGEQFDAENEISMRRRKPDEK